MKRVLRFGNSVVMTAVFVGLLCTATSFTLAPAVDAALVDDGPQKKEQRVKVIVNTDGKETKIDTTFTLPDEKMINFKVDSMLKKMDIEPGKFDVMVHRPGKRMKFGNHGEANLPKEEDFDILIQHGDSGMQRHIRKIIHMGKDGRIVSFGEQDGDVLMPPPPPMPPAPPSLMNWPNHADPFAFDTNDPSIISYDKKDIGKGLEKITIVRKKKIEHNPVKEVEVETEVSSAVKK